MQVSTVLGILGIIVSSLFGLWGVYTTIIQRRYPGRITFIIEDIIGLFDTIVKNLPELRILYNEAPVTPSLVFLKAAMLNRGKKDIDASMVETPITLYLPEHYRWLTSRVVSTSHDVNADVDIKDERSLQVIISGLFRVGEYIRIEILAEVPPGNELSGDSQVSMSNKLQNAITLQHRIPDTRMIEVRDLEFRGVGARKLKRVMPLFAIVILLAFLFASKLLPEDFPAELVYDYQTENGQVIKVAISPKSDNTVKLRGLEERFNAVLPVEQFIELSRINKRVRVDTVNKYLARFLFAIFVAMPMMLLTSLYYSEFWEKRKIRKLLELRQHSSVRASHP
ncbi:MAG: hypothetical protein HYY96_09180 [Candidatus Tectomicrobia bacterium]|nr:hypothetical protein [Candidatus Tectomicrobia bacterium]